MMQRLNLALRGLILIGVPTLFQICFVGFLAVLLLNLVDETAKESHATDLMTRTYLATMKSAGAIVGTMIEVESKDLGVGNDTGEKQLQSIRKSWSEVTNAEGNSPEELACIKKFDATLQRSITAMQQIRLEISNPDSNHHERMLELNSELTQCASDIMDTVGELEKAEAAAGESTLRKKSKEMREAALYWMSVIVALSVLATIALGAIYVIGIKRPFDRLVEDSRLLSQEKILPLPMNGNDEMSSLDRVIYKVSRALAESHERERQLLENASEMICSVDNNLCIRSANATMLHSLLLNAEKLNGMSILDLVSHDSVQATVEHMESCRRGESTHLLELCMVDSNGRQLDTEWSSFWSEEHGLLFVVIRDVSSKKKLQRMKNDFINMISHDLRSPLMSMHASISLVIEGVRGQIPPAVRSIMESSVSDIDKLTGYVNDLLDFQKWQAGKMVVRRETFELRDVLQEACDLSHSFASARNIEVELPAANFPINADRVKLRQVFMNLLSNAVKFSPSGSTVVIDVEKDAEVIEVSVKDRGPGVPQKYQESIFEAFEQVPGKTNDQGSGLGLAICKMIVQAHDGEIGMRNVGVDGAAFGNQTYENCYGIEDGENRDTGDNDDHGDNNSCAESGSIFWVRIPATKS